MTYPVPTGGTDEFGTFLCQAWMILIAQNQHSCSGRSRRWTTRLLRQFRVLHMARDPNIGEKDGRVALDKTWVVTTSYGEQLRYAHADMIRKKMSRQTRKWHSRNVLRKELS